ncbi:MAG TPA: transglycosylase SLT domain-containing protein [Vicinamibacterales bacterium]|nr:transglycosylase SLT domain-containing protein [Vicinamibacterales bacterium]
MTTKIPTVVIGAALVASVSLSAQLVVPGRAGAPVAPARLSATAHPPIPSDLTSMWLVPQQGAKLGPALTNFVRGVRLLEEEDRAAAALPLFRDGALSTTPVADYARYYTGLALMKLERYAEADAVFADLAARKIEGHLPEDASFALAEVREAQKDYQGAVTVYESLVTRKLAQPHVAWLRLGLAADLAGSPARSVDALRRAYYDFPSTAESDRAGDALDKQDVELDQAFASKELARADTLYQARRWTGAKKSYERVKPFVSGAERDRVALRIAAADISLGRYREGRDALRPYLTGPLAEEANFHVVNAVRGLKLTSEHRTLAREFVEKFPASPFGEEILNNLASAYIIDDEDADADGVFREILDRYPAGRFAERAAWKAGWWAYRQGRFSDALQYFDKGSAQFPRSDYRPSWLYWAGRAAQQAGDVETGVARLKLAATDYHNSYYGRLAVKRLQGERGAAVAPTLQRQPLAAPAIPTAGRIASLLSLGLNREAMNELQYAQRVWGDSPPLQATIAVTHRRMGNVRAGINAMKRAYPQYLAAGGETMPSEILQVIFPVDYWPLLQKYAKDRGLDPYTVAALVAQESNFDPVVVSHANAYGLMQILPSTGRSYARKLGVRPFSTNRLKEAEINVRLGTQIFADDIRKFGGVHFALAAYNAGGSRVVRWQREKPGLPQDEFIDDIPFPETQNYVKRILGTAEDYRNLYGSR